MKSRTCSTFFTNVTKEMSVTTKKSYLHLKCILDNCKYIHDTLMMLVPRYYILLMVIAVPLAIYLWPTFLGGDTEFLIVQGKSMLPTIEGGSLVIIKRMDAYQVGDIVSFTLQEENAKMVIVHRIIEESPKGFVIKGDNNPFTDVGFHNNDDIHGKVVFATPYVGSLLGWARNPMTMLISLAAMLVIQLEQKRRRKKKEKLRRIRFGITKKDDIEIKEKPKKPDYKVFFGAIGFNVLTYVFTNYAINVGSKPQGDMVTGFIYRIFE